MCVCVLDKEIKFKPTISLYILYTMSLLQKSTVLVTKSLIHVLVPKDYYTCIHVLAT